MKCVAIYARVSTDQQTTSNQIDELSAWADRAGYKVAKIFQDQGISGAKGRDKRPGFDALLKGAVRREFDVVAVWSCDRLGRSLQHLIEALQVIRQTGVGLYIHTQALDTMTSAGKALFQMLGVFAEFERELIQSRINAGIARAKAEGTRSGKPFGRPRGANYSTKEISDRLLAGASVRQVVKATRASIGAVAKVRKALVAGGALQRARLAPVSYSILTAKSQLR